MSYTASQKIKTKQYSILQLTAYTAYKSSQILWPGT